MQLLHFTIAIVYICQYAKLLAIAYLTEPEFDTKQLLEHLNQASNKRTSQDENGIADTSAQETEETPALDSILNVRVLDESELCPRKSVVMFFATGDLRYLNECQDVNEEPDGNDVTSQQYGNQPSDTQSSDDGMSYSGRLLKRILQNMNHDGLTDTDDTGSDAGEREGHKRSPRLSINGALSSLADMLRHNSRRYHHAPRYGFRQRLRTLGR